MPPDPPRSSALRASLLPLRGNYISHSIQTKNLGIYVTASSTTFSTPATSRVKCKKCIDKSRKLSDAKKGNRRLRKRVAELKQTIRELRSVSIIIYLLHNEYVDQIYSVLHVESFLYIANIISFRIVQATFFFSFSIVVNYINHTKQRKEKSNWFGILFSLWLQGDIQFYTDLQLPSSINLSCLPSVQICFLSLSFLF